VSIGKIALALVAGSLVLLTSCSSKDKTVSVPDDDPEMQAAISKARASLPQFWQTFSAHSQGEKGFALKVRIKDSNTTEHFWAIDLEHHESKTMGTINNDPNKVSTVKLGERIKIPEADISDWMYLRDGKVVGNYTLRPLLKKMPAKEAEQLSKMLADP